MSAEQQQELLDEAERRAEELKALQDRAVAIVAAILGASLLAAMPRIRKAYRRYMEALRPAEKDPAGNTYRPVAGTGAQAAKRLAEIQAAAAAFASDRDMGRIEREIAAVLKAASDHGARYAATMGSIQGLAIGDPVPIPDELLRARVAAITGTIRAQATDFRNVITQVVADGAARDIGGKRIERLVIEAYRGAEQADGTVIKRGLIQRLGVEISTDVSVSSATNSTSAVRAAGGTYVRWVTASDEKVCPYCASRHGRIYLSDRITIPAHRKCRCVGVIVDADQVEAAADVRNDVLDAPFWQQEERRTVLAYAKAHNLSEAQARSKLADHLQRPTAAEKMRYPGVERSTPPSYQPPAYDPATTEVPGL